jgi:hypothetical protein
LAAAVGVASVLAGRVVLAEEPAATGAASPGGEAPAEAPHVETGSPGPAAAAADHEAPPTVRPTWRQASPAPAPSPEIGLAGLQVVVGSLAMLITLFPIAFAADAHEALGVFALSLGPAVGGFVVCGLGGTSATYDGGCGTSVVGAYVGALTAIPLVFIGCELDDPEWDTGGCVAGAALGFIAGYFVGTALGATLGWHIGKRPRARGIAFGPRDAGRLSAEWAELKPRPLAATGGERRIAIPLIQFSF